MIPSCASLNAFSLISLGNTNCDLILPSLVFKIRYNSSPLILNLVSPGFKSSAVLVLSTLSQLVVKVASAFCNLIRSTRCLLYTSDAADEEDSVDLGGRR